MLICVSMKNYFKKALDIPWLRMDCCGEAR